MAKAKKEFVGIVRDLHDHAQKFGWEYGGRIESENSTYCRFVRDRESVVVRISNHPGSPWGSDMWIDPGGDGDASVDDVRRMLESPPTLESIQSLRLRLEDDADPADYIDDLRGGE